MDNIIVLKLSKEEYLKLLEMVNNGWATDFEKLIYFHCYGLSVQDQNTTIASFI